MITLDTFNMVMLAIAVTSIVLNIIQFQTKRTIFKPIQNGLIGLLNDVKNKGTYCHGRRNLIFARNTPYNTIEVLRWNFSEFITETISHFESLREHIVPILKTIEPSEERVFKAADFALSKEEKEARQKFHEKWQIQQEIEQRRLAKELQQLKNIEGRKKRNQR